MKRPGLRPGSAAASGSGGKFPNSLRSNREISDPPEPLAAAAANGGRAEQSRAEKSKAKQTSLDLALPFRQLQAQAVEFGGHAHLATEPAVGLARRRGALQQVVLVAPDRGQARQPVGIDQHMAGTAHRGTAAFADDPFRAGIDRGAHERGTGANLEVDQPAAGQRDMDGGHAGARFQAGVSSSGRAFIARSELFRCRTCGAASSTRLTRRARALSTISPSRRATIWPTQPWMPAPKTTWPTGRRSMSKTVRVGPLARVAVGRGQQAQHLVIAATGMPAISQSRPAVRKMVCAVDSQRSAFFEGWLRTRLGIGPQLGVFIRMMRQAKQHVADAVDRGVDAGGKERAHQHRRLLMALISPVSTAS